MRAMRRHYEKVDCVVDAECDDSSSNMARMAVHNQQSSLGRISWPSMRIENLGKPLIAMAIRCPATLACSKLPVWRRVLWYPRRVGVFCLENDQWRQRFARCAYTLNGRYPLLPARY